jgi:hypothetical protein
MMIYCGRLRLPVIRCQLHRVDYAVQFFADLMQLVPEIRKHREMGRSFATHAPKPEPELRDIPRY